MTSRTSFRLSMNELTATRSMRFVVAWYSTFNTLASSEPVSAAGTTESCLRTRGDSSGSTPSASRAVEASRGVGSGTLRALRRNVSWCGLERRRSAAGEGLH